MDRFVRARANEKPLHKWQSTRGQSLRAPKWNSDCCCTIEFATTSLSSLISAHAIVLAQAASPHEWSPQPKRVQNGFEAGGPAEELDNGFEAGGPAEDLAERIHHH